MSSNNQPVSAPSLNLGARLGKASTFSIEEAQAIVPQLIARRVPLIIEYAVGVVLLSATEANWNHVISVMHELGSSHDQQYHLRAVDNLVLHSAPADCRPASLAYPPPDAHR